jgi:hypothetical protein
VLVCPHDGAIDEVQAPVELALGIGLSLQRRNEAIPDAGSRPAIEAG